MMGTFGGHLHISIDKQKKIRAETRIIRWMCGMKWLVIEDIVKVIQINRLQWYGHVLRKDDDIWVKNVLLWMLMVPDEEVGPGKHGKRLWTRIRLKTK